MGSGMVPPKLGFMLQDRGVFDLSEGKAIHMLLKKTISYHNSDLLQRTPFMSFGVMVAIFSRKVMYSANEPN
jgi:gamma-glutamyltranspeptidase/glutathione hydrolase